MREPLELLCLSSVCDPLDVLYQDEPVFLVAARVFPTQSFPVFKEIHMSLLRLASPAVL